MVINMTFWGIMIPFIGTSLGSGCVLFMKKRMSPHIAQTLLGFAGGVMVAASVWSLLIPSISRCAGLGRLAFLPATIGFVLGVCLLPAVDRITPRLKLGKTSLLALAVTIHNIPEGMAVGVIFAGVLYGNCGVTLADAMALSIGIAIQNFPEGAIISMPVMAQTCSRKKALLYGVLSGVVEPVTAGATLVLFGLASVALPYLLAFAAGAMIYVVVQELIPQASRPDNPTASTLAFSLGFLVMMILDVAFG